MKVRLQSLQELQSLQTTQKPHLFGSMGNNVGVGKGG